MPKVKKDEINKEIARWYGNDPLVKGIVDALMTEDDEERRNEDKVKEFIEENAKQVLYYISKAYVMITQRQHFIMVGSQKVFFNRRDDRRDGDYRRDDRRDNNYGRRDERQDDRRDNRHDDRRDNRDRDNRDRDNDTSNPNDKGRIKNEGQRMLDRLNQNGGGKNRRW